MLFPFQLLELANLVLEVLDDITLPARLIILYELKGAFVYPTLQIK